MSVVMITINTSGKAFRGAGSIVDRECAGRELSRLLTMAAYYFCDEWERDLYNIDAPCQSEMNIEVYD